MEGKDAWPQLLSQTSNSTHEQRIANIKKCRERLQNGEEPPPEVIEGWLNAIEGYLEDTIHTPINEDVTNPIEMMSARLNKNHSKMEEKNAVILNGITELTTSLKSSPSSAIKAGPGSLPLQETEGGPQEPMERRKEESEGGRVTSE